MIKEMKEDIRAAKTLFNEYADLLTHNKEIKEQLISMMTKAYLKGYKNALQRTKDLVETESSAINNVAIDRNSGFIIG